MREIKALPAHPLGNLAGNPPVRLGVTCRLYSFPHPLHPSLGIGEGAILLGKGHRWQNNMS
ncbi:hypothetical protein ES703_105046 [subsurface metagenome]